MLPMLDIRHDLSLSRAIAREFVGDHHARSLALLLEEFAQETLGGFCVTPALNQNVEHDPMLIDGSPDPMLLTRNTDYDLIQVPFVSGCRETTADLVRKVLAELSCPLPDRLVADLDAPGGEHLLDKA